MSLNQTKLFLSSESDSKFSCLDDLNSFVKIGFPVSSCLKNLVLSSLNDFENWKFLSCLDLKNLFSGLESWDFSSPKCLSPIPSPSPKHYLNYLFGSGTQGLPVALEISELHIHSFLNQIEKTLQRFLKTCKRQETNFFYQTQNVYFTNFWTFSGLDLDLSPSFESGHKLNTLYKLLVYRNCFFSILE